MKIIFLSALAYLLMITTGYTASEPILTAISKSYSSNNIQLFCSFTIIPNYTINTKEKRIDLVLAQTIAAADLILPVTDGKIVKILSQVDNKTTTISFFFRYPPQKVQAVLQPDTNKLVLDILLGNEFTATRPVLAEKLQGMSALQRQTKDFSNPLNTSPYPGNWQTFFKEYEAKILIEPKVQFSLVPFPAITLLPPEKEENIAILPSEIIEGAKLNLWHDLTALIVEQINQEKNGENKKKLILTYGDILLRAGNFKEAYKQLYPLSVQHSTEPIGLLAQYLVLRLQAESADFYLADIGLKNLAPLMANDNPATPFFLLTRIEAALASKQFERMDKLLKKDDISSSASLMSIKALRQADYWLATGDFIKAHTGYQLLKDSVILSEDFFSLNGYCGLLYQHKQFQQAADCYGRLIKITSPEAQKHLDIISFRLAMAKLHTTPGATHESDMINDFAEIATRYPDSEAGDRAWLKQIDLKLLTLKNWEKPAVIYYQELAETGPSRSIREEAAFKEALVYHLLDQKAKSMELLMTFLRDYRGGVLHDTGLALLIETLPELLKEYLNNGKHIEALVLAKQNRFLFVKNWIDISLLAELAEANRQLGFFNEASRMYSYLLDVSSQEDKAPYYLPLIKLVYEQGDFGLAEAYADQYSYHYPKGKDRIDILYLRLQSLMTQSKNDEALALFAKNNTEDILKDQRFKLLQASLFFHLSDYAQVKTIVEELKIDSADQQPEMLFMLAESCYQLGDTSQAEELFFSLQQDSLYKDQSLFRLAELAQQKGQTESALKLFSQLVETGNNPLWQNLARKELELNALSR